MNKFITVSPSPHVYGGNSVNKLMYGVIIAMIPALIASVVMYGTGAIIVVMVSVAACLLFEYLIQKFILKTEVRITDGSAIVTGMLLAFNLPSNLPWWIIVVGALVAIGIGKMTFGGLGNNPFNPALVGRVFLLISFPGAMTIFPKAQGWNTPYIIAPEDIDTYTGATPLSLIKNGIKSGQGVSELLDASGLHYNDLFFGNIGGSLGEIAAFALILGLIYMLIRKIVTWHIPLSVVGSVFFLSGILWMFSYEGHQVVLNSINLNLPVIQYKDAEGTLKMFHMADPIFHILTGGVMLGAIFMATDYVTSPMTPKGMVVYGIMIGVITVTIRIFGSYPEGISFAILVMNGFTPLINRYIKPTRFGEEVKNG